MRKLRYAKAARQDLQEIAKFITREGEGIKVAAQFVKKLRDRCERIASLPGTLGTARPDLGETLRSSPHKAYVIFFRYTGDYVEIINILSASRDVIAYFGVGE